MLARALLVALLLHARKVRTRDELIDALWGECPPVAATASLHNLVSSLRRVLGAWRIETAHGGYVLQVGDGEIDAAEFERLVGLSRSEPATEKALTLERALALWRGWAFLDLRYESFVQGEARRLEELRVHAEEELVAAKLELGDCELLVAELQQMVVDFPLRERCRMLFMVALYRCGRSIEALAAYADWQRVLRDSGGLVPSPRIHELAEAIHAGYLE